MTILTIGSINIDHAYRVTRHPAPGETVLDKGYLRGLGGKGANMSLAAAAGGAKVRHAGAVGQDGVWCKDRIAEAGIDVTDVRVGNTETGHGLIMVDDSGENVIVVHSGANQALTPDLVQSAIGRAQPGDWLLLQNETNLVAEAARAARAAGLKVAYGAAPFDPGAASEMLALADLIAVNQVEADQLSAHTNKPLDQLGVPALLITLGADGAIYRTGATTTKASAFAVDPVDTTGAGDTFFGFFLAGLDQGQEVPAALKRAAAAAALQVTRPGAAEAIPSGTEVDAFLTDSETN